jgi:hypothetical protein
MKFAWKNHTQGGLGTPLFKATLDQLLFLKEKFFFSVIIEIIQKTLASGMTLFYHSNE